MITVVLPVAGLGTWTVPSGCTVIAALELLGAGGDGISGGGGEIATGCSGAGASYAKYENIPVTPGDDISYQIGLHGTTADGADTPGAADTWFKDSTEYFTMGGSTGANALGGFRCAGSPSVFYRGGNSNSTADLVGCPGAGGSAGPDGRGGDAGEIELFPFNSGGTGGGAADGGGNSSASVGAPGTDGGTSRDGDPGGEGATGPTTPGGDGSNGSGGGGGYGAGTDNNSGGGRGSWKPLWTDSATGVQYGPSSGAGGPGYSNNQPVDGSNASEASPDGGGRGGAGSGTAGVATPGIGDNGLIIISFVPEQPRGKVYMRKLKMRFKAQPAPIPVRPFNNRAPSIDRAVVGQVTTGDPGGWEGTPPITYDYQFKAAGADVGTDATTYTPVSGDSGKALDWAVTATNDAGSVTVTSNAITVTEGGGGPMLDIPDRAALDAAVAAWPTTGDLTWLLGAADFGAIDFSGKDFSAHPVVIAGQATVGQTTVTSMRFDGASGFTFSGGHITLNDTTPNAATVSIFNTDPTFVPVLTFSNILSNSGLPMGQNVGTGYLIENVNKGTIRINGQGNAAKPDVWGRGSSIVFSTVGQAGGTVLLNGLTLDNQGTDAIIGAGAQNITIKSVLSQNQFKTDDGHPDACQFFSDSSGTPSQDILIEDSGFDQGAAGEGQQGIFLEGVKRLTARRTWIRSSTYNNGVSCAGCDEITIEDGLIQGIDAPSGGGAVFYRGASTNGVITNTEAVAIVVIEGATATQSGNSEVDNAVSISDYAAQEAWAALNPTARLHA